MSVHLEPLESPTDGTGAGPGRALVLTLDRPPLNILDLTTLEELDEALDEAEAQLEEEPALSLVVLRGAGPRAFSAGVSIEDHTPEKVPAMLAGLHGPARRLASLPVPTLAVVHGHCLGGGLELAASCDLLLTDAEAQFGVPEVKLGCFPPLAAAWWPERLGRGRALELILTGRTFGAEEAHELSLATWVAPPGGLDDRLAQLVGKLTAGSAAVARLIRRAVARPDPSTDPLQQAERLYQEELLPLADMEEGLQAFQQKRRPKWRHC